MGANEKRKKRKAPVKRRRSWWERLDERLMLQELRARTMAPRKSPPKLGKTSPRRPEGMPKPIKPAGTRAIHPAHLVKRAIVRLKWVKLLPKLALKAKAKRAAKQIKQVKANKITNKALIPLVKRKLKGVKLY